MTSEPRLRPRATPWERLETTELREHRAGSPGRRRAGSACALRRAGALRRLPLLVATDGRHRRARHGSPAIPPEHPGQRCHRRRRAVVAGQAVADRQGDHRRRVASPAVRDDDVRSGRTQVRTSPCCAASSASAVAPAGARLQCDRARARSRSEIRSKSSRGLRPSAAGLPPDGSREARDLGSAVATVSSWGPAQSGARASRAKPFMTETAGSPIAGS